MQRICRDCKHFNPDLTSPSSCAAPGNTMPDYVDGAKPRVIYPSAQSVRIDPMMCGPTAKWFEAARVQAAA